MILDSVGIHRLFRADATQIQERDSIKIKKNKNCHEFDLVSNST